MTKDYIKALRKKVGHEPIILNFAQLMIRMKSYFKKDLILMHGVCLAVLQNLENQNKKHAFESFQKKLA